MTTAEESLLCACLLAPDAYWRVADLVGGDDFADPANAALWGLISDVARVHRDYDAFTVAEAAQAKGIAGLAKSAMSLVSGTGSPRAVRSYADALVAQSVRRKFLRTRDRIAHLDGPEAITEAYRLLASCRPRDVASVARAREFFRASMEKLQRRFDSDVAITGLPCGIDKIDEMTCGWQPGDLIILGARPSVGKTALALQFGLHAAVQVLAGTLFFSLEQSGQQLMDRAACHLGRIPFDAIRDPKRMPDECWTRLTAAAAQINEMPMWIDETCGTSVDAICARARQQNAEGRLGLIVIDYLQHMATPKADTLAESTQIITRALKSLAKELAAPILLLSQLNRDGVGRPKMSDLRNSGAIEQDADVIMLMHRPDEQVRTHTLVEIAKQRNGPTGDVHLESRLDLMRFDWYATPPAPPQTSARPFKPRATGSRYNGGQP